MLKSSGETAMEEALLKVYKDYGLKTFLGTCSDMLRIHNADNTEKKKKANGVVCEIVLFVMTIHYLKRRGVQGQVFHSLILGDPDNPKGNFRTELDFTVLTPGVCLTGECKSLVGSIDVVDECLLVRGDFKADVARQSKLHGKILRKHLTVFSTQEKAKKAPPFGLFCFVYSNGAIQDKRSEKDKALIPVLTIKDLYPYYDRMFPRFKEEVFDYDKAKEFFEASSSSEDLYRQHRDFLGY